MTSRPYYPYAIVALMLLVLVVRMLTGGHGSGEATVPQVLPTANVDASSASVAEDYDALSVRYNREGMPAKSVEASRQAIRLNPNVAIYFNNLCAAYNDLGSYRDAMTACQNALKIDPALQLAKNNLSWALSHDGKK
jgi:tetratricopeptide (TPR) repeat protein